MSWIHDVSAWLGLPGHHVVGLVAGHEVVSRVPSSEDQRHLWLAILVGALSVEVAVERRGRVVDGVPVPVSREEDF